MAFTPVILPSQPSYSSQSDAAQVLNTQAQIVMRDLTAAYVAPAIGKCYLGYLRYSERSNWQPQP